MLSSIININNKVFKNNYLRMILLLISSVFMGYTLQPVPKWLNNLFDTSNILKFFILFISGTLAVYPLNNENIIYVTVCSILVLVIFNVSRKYEKKLEENKKI
jgi:hypothetical protein